MVSPQQKMARVHFGSGIVYGLYERPIIQRTLPSESFIEKPIVYSVLPTELEALRESPELTVKTETVGYVKLRATGSVKLNSVSAQHNSLIVEFSASIASYWVTISLLSIFVLISFILSFLFLSSFMQLL